MQGGNAAEPRARLGAQLPHPLELLEVVEEVARPDLAADQQLQPVRLWGRKAVKGR